MVSVVPLTLKVNPESDALVIDDLVACAEVGDRVAVQAGKRVLERIVAGTAS